MAFFACDHAAFASSGDRSEQFFEGRFHLLRERPRHDLRLAKELGKALGYVANAGTIFLFLLRALS